MLKLIHFYRSGALATIDVKKLGVFHICHFSVILVFTTRWLPRIVDVDPNLLN